MLTNLHTAALGESLGLWGMTQKQFYLLHNLVALRKRLECLSMQEAGGQAGKAKLEEGRELAPA